MKKGTIAKLLFLLKTIGIYLQVFQAAVYGVNVLILCGHCAISLSCSKNIAMSPQPCIEIVWPPCAFQRALRRQYVAAMRSQYPSRTAILGFLFQKDHLKSWGCLTIFLQSPHGDRTGLYDALLYGKTWGLQAYSFFLIFALKYRLWVHVRTASLRRF